MNGSASVRLRKLSRFVSNRLNVAVFIEAAASARLMKPSRFVSSASKLEVRAGTVFQVQRPSDQYTEDSSDAASARLTKPSRLTSSASNDHAALGVPRCRYCMCGI